MANPLRIAVTGATGFIGKRIVAEAAASGYDVLALSRSGVKVDGASRHAAWMLGDPLPPDAHTSFDYAIHLAHDFGGPMGARRSIEGTLLAVDQLRKTGARHQLFFSSLSARPDAISLYGKSKFEIENAIRTQPDISIVRPGLVLGDGGLYGRIRNWVRDWPFAPLPDGGRGKIYVIGISELCARTLDILAEVKNVREFDLFESESKSLRELVQEEARKSGRQVIVIPVPARLLQATLVFAERLGVPLPVTSENLVGFLANQAPYPVPVAKS